jgi:molecular chaperone DnaK
LTHDPIGEQLSTGSPIGIDLGTTYSAAAVLDPSGRPLVLRNNDGQTTTPSVVLFEGGEVLVGQQAKMQRAAFPDDVVQFVKRQMGNPSWKFYGTNGDVYTPEGISALILKRLTDDADTQLGYEVKQVVITVPAYFDDAQRNATKQAGVIAGLDVLSIINEPTAAAVSFGVEQDYEGTVLVYDLGGGTFDVTLLKSGSGVFDIVRTDGDRNLGGFDFDNRIIQWAREEFARRTGTEFVDDDAAEAQLRDRAEQAKHRLSSSDQAPMFVSNSGKTEKLVLTRQIFEEITSSLLQRTRMLTEDLVDESGLKMSDIDKVLLVGGSTRMPMVRDMVADVTAQAPDQSIHPDEAVARGAALVADLRKAHRTGGTNSAHSIVINDVVSHGLGVVCLDERHIDTNSIIIPSNSRIPCKKSKHFWTVVDDQTEINVQVTEGDETELRYVKVLGQATLRIPPHPASSPVDVIFSCDIDGILHIEVTDLTIDMSLGEFEIDRQANLSQAEIERMRDAVAALDLQ